MTHSLLRPAVAVLAMIALLVGTGCDKKSSGGGPLKDDLQKFSYAIGMDMGTSLKDMGEMDMDMLIKGFTDARKGDTLLLTEEEAQTIIMNEMQKRRDAQAKEAEAKSKAFLESNGKKQGVTTTASGLQYEVITEGQGPKPRPEQFVTVHYTGTLVDGKEFDSSVKRGEPVTFPLNGVIPGWTEGVQLMSAGAKYRMVIPPALAYGDRGAGGVIPPNAALIFEVELISFSDNPPAPQDPAQGGNPHGNLSVEEQRALQEQMRKLQEGKK